MIKKEHRNDIILVTLILILALCAVAFPGGTYRWITMMKSYNIGPIASYETFSPTGAKSPIGAKGYDGTSVLFPANYYKNTVVYLAVTGLSVQSVTFRIYCSMPGWFTFVNLYGVDYTKTFTAVGDLYVPITTPCDFVFVSAQPYSVSAGRGTTVHVMIGGVGVQN